MSDDSVSKTIEILSHVIKGSSHKETHNVSGAVAEEIVKRLDTSYVAKSISVLHKPFLAFKDLDGHQFCIAIEDIRRIKVYVKAVATQ